MHSIQIPTYNDLQHILMYSSPHLTPGVVSVLDHNGITPSLLEEINQESDDSLLQDSIFDELGEV